MIKHSPLLMDTERNNFGESGIVWFTILESIPKEYSFIAVAFLLVHTSMQTGSHLSLPKRPSLCPLGRSDQFLPGKASENRWYLNYVLKKEELP